MKRSRFVAKYKIYFDRARTYASYIQFVLLLKLVLSDSGINSNLFLIIAIFISMLLFLLIGYLDTKLGIRGRELENHTLHNPVLMEMYRILKDEKKLRFNETLDFLNKNVSTGKKILDLGVKSELSEFLSKNGYDIRNTKGENLDYDYTEYLDSQVTTAFEIFEHMLAPYNILASLSGKLVCSVPLNVWFSPSYWNKKDTYDCHYHEFEVKQFNHLLERTGWKIYDSKIVRKPDKFKLGVRPLLRFIWPSYYFVCAEKNI